MKPLIIKMTEDTPAVVFFPKYGKFQIIGTSWPEHAKNFYEQIHKWIFDYFNNQPLEETVFEFYFKYFNTSSFKEIIRIIEALKNYSKKFKIRIKWFYEPDDLDMKKFGEQIEQHLNIKLEYGTKKIKG